MLLVHWRGTPAVNRGPGTVFRLPEYDPYMIPPIRFHMNALKTTSQGIRAILAPKPFHQ